MPLKPGTRLGSYEVTAQIGAGGMGEVYRARDTKLQRDVAIKVLPDQFASDPDRPARFEREARTLAALNHPNIAQIFGFEQAQGVSALVMELVAGDDLSALIARGPMPVAEAVQIGRQIADALEAAHDQGIIHRDLKPANVKVRADGTVKVLDFGLAKALGPEGSNATADAMNSPTLTARGTQIGMILGTAAYMAPEQAKGKAVDKRADIWAFGVVLYEMLSGTRAFDAEDVSTTLAAVLMKDPDWNVLPASTPASLTRLIRRCLERDPKKRLRDIGEARILLADTDSLHEQPSPAAAPAPFAARRARAPILPWTLAGLGLTAAAVAFGSGLFRAAPAAPPVRFTVSYPPGVRPLSNGSDFHGGTISPDGQYVAFSGADAKTGKVSIYVRRLDDLAPAIVPGTAGGRYPFWAPNSRTIAFYAQGKLQRVDLDGGSPMVICDAPTGGWGGTWNSDDVILAGLTDPGPIQRVSAKGGSAPVPVTTIETGANDHDWPAFLPDERHFIYVSWSSDFQGSGVVYGASIDSPDRTVIVKDVFHPMVYADPGYLLFIRAGSLVAQALDVKTFKLHGDPIAIAANATGPITASKTGSISFSTLPGESSRAQLTRLVSIDRDGGNERVLLDTGFFVDPAIKPDGSQLAYARKESESGTFDIWIRDLTSGQERRLTFDPGDDRAPVWSPGGDEIVFARNSGLYRRKASGAGDELQITAKDAPASSPYQWTAGGFITHYGGVTSSDILKLSLADLKSTPLLTSPSVNEMRGAVSPDGKWLAYDARETARFEVYLTTFPPSAAKWMVTTEGGAEAKWTKDGKELFYVSSATGALMAVPVTTGDPPVFGAHRQVHPGPLDWGWNASHSFDLDPASGRIVLSVLSESVELTTLLNWQAVLKK